MTFIAELSPDEVAKLTYQVNKYTEAMTRAAKTSDQTARAIKSQGNEMAILTGKINPAVAATTRQTAAEGKLANVLGEQSVRTSYDPADLSALGKGADDFRFEVDPQIARDAKYSPPPTDSPLKDNSIIKGAGDAFDDYRQKATDVAGLSKDVFTSAFDTMATGVANFAKTGKFSFSDFTHSVLVDLAKIATEKAAVGFLGSLFDIGANLFAGPTTTSLSVGGTDTIFNPALDTSLLGSPAKVFAKGGAFTNGVVSSPTLFGMAGGQTGLMGEAGPEAIIPLTRASNGALGVRAVGGFGGGASIQVDAPVSITTQDRGNDGMQLDQQALQQNLQKQMTAAAERAVADSWRAGGISYRNANGRA